MYLEFVCFWVSYVYSWDVLYVFTKAGRYVVTGTEGKGESFSESNKGYFNSQLIAQFVNW